MNVLDMRWVWKCPSCDAIIALDRKHPFFDGRFVFSRRMWEVVAAGRLSLVDMAYVLETSPEWGMYAAREIYRLQVPEHVQQQWEEYNAEGTDAGDVDGGVS